MEEIDPSAHDAAEADDIDRKRKMLAKHWLTIAVPFAVVGLVQWFQYVAAASIGVGFGAFFVLAYRYSPWFLGPIEWATYDTTLNGKIIYLFRGRDAPAYDEFIEKLEDAIERARNQHSNVGEKRQTSESANSNEKE